MRHDDGNGNKPSRISVIFGVDGNMMMPQGAVTVPS